MSAAGPGGSAESAISSNLLLAIGIIGGLLGIYLIGINSIIGPVLASLGAVCAIVWGSDAIRRVASYGLGTGVPSIGYMCLSIGVIGSLAGISIPHILKIPEFLGPIFSLIFAMIIGLVVAVIAKKIVGMKIPILEQCTAEIAGAAGLSILGFSVAIVGTYEINDILVHVIAPGFIAVFFIMNTMAIQHPFNACLGPNEDQIRTLKCAASTAFLAMTITGLLAIISGEISWFAIFIVGLIGWIISFYMFVHASFDAAASVKWAGLWPDVEE